MMALVDAKVVFSVAALLIAGLSVRSADLADGFRNPPASAKPHTWWHWTKEDALLPSGLLGPVELKFDIITK